ncbi:hypothetical protein ILYODFUR_031745 [Ilyodon furcidens]|uniref:Uncharacterized protein n=1 Tax=Ilyodon furcidens TaxID=33524 RepID=A0ABV0TZS2_9TELE
MNTWNIHSYFDIIVIFQLVSQLYTNAPFPAVGKVPFHQRQLLQLAFYMMYGVWADWMLQAAIWTSADFSPVSNVYIQLEVVSGESFTSGHNSLLYLIAVETYAYVDKVLVQPTFLSPL